MGIASNLVLFILSGQSNMVGVDVDKFQSYAPTNSVIVKVAKGGEPMSGWVKGNEPGRMYKAIKTRVTKAISNQTQARVVLVWVHGEKDTQLDLVKSYTYKLMRLISWIERDFGKPFVVIGRLSDYGVGMKAYPHWDKIRTDQVKLAESSDRYAWVDTDDLDEGIHYKDYEEFAKRLADASKRLLEHYPSR